MGRQADDDTKKAYCESSIDKAEDEHKVLEQTAADLEVANLCHDRDQCHRSYLGTHVFLV